MGHTSALRAASNKLCQVWVQLQAGTGIAALCCTAPFKPDWKPIDVSLRTGLSVNCIWLCKKEVRKPLGLGGGCWALGFWGGMSYLWILIFHHDQLFFLFDNHTDIYHKSFSSWVTVWGTKKTWILISLAGSRLYFMFYLKIEWTRHIFSQTACSEIHGHQYFFGATLNLSQSNIISQLQNNRIYIAFFFFFNHSGFLGFFNKKLVQKAQKCSQSKHHIGLGNCSAAKAVIFNTGIRRSQSLPTYFLWIQHLLGVDLKSWPRVVWSFNDVLHRETINELMGYGLSSVNSILSL